MESEHLMPAGAEGQDATSASAASETALGRVEAPSGVSTLWLLLSSGTLPQIGGVLVLLAVLIFQLNAMIGRELDLGAFLLTVSAGAVTVTLGWRLHALYRTLDRRHRASRGQAMSQEPDPLERLASLPLWHDTLVRHMLAVALAANLVVFGYVSAMYRALPPFLPLHYSATGDVDRLGTPPEVFMMPGIGVVVLLANLVAASAIYRRERLASLLLVGTSIFVQLLLLVATVSIVSRA